MGGSYEPAGPPHSAGGSGCHRKRVSAEGGKIPDLILIDGDLQHDETILPQMLAKLEADQAEVVIGSRNVVGGAMGEGLSPIRR